MIDIRETILAQYANSPALTGIISRFNAAADPRRLIETFLQDVWNPATATGWGLDVWGRIVGVGRVQKVPRSEYLGFKQAADENGTARPFDDGIFYNGSSSVQNYALDDIGFRKLILAKAAANISSGSIADINRILMILFGDRGKIYLSEGVTGDDYWGFSAALNEHGPQPFNSGIFFSNSSLAGATGVLTVCYTWDLSPLEAVLIQSSGALPRPAGVRVQFLRVRDPEQTDFSGDIL